MNEYDALCEEAWSMLARIINGAGRKRETSASACPVVEVPLGLLYQARGLLDKRKVYGNTESMKQATQRVFE